MNTKNEIEILVIELEMNWNIISNCSDDSLETRELIEQCKHQIQQLIKELKMEELV